jgi:stearoyl-CoA desaturase (delta-9 desaturase)
MPTTSKTASPLLFHRVSLLEQMTPIIGTIATIVLAFLYGLPAHAVVSFFLVGVTTALGVTVGFHRLFTHRSFATSKFVEWTLMVLGCMAGQSAPFFWIATHRTHHQHSDEDGDPHSPHVREGLPLGFWRGFWHAHSGWVLTEVQYSADSISDLNRRPDLVWINRHWVVWYLVRRADRAPMWWPPAAIRRPSGHVRGKLHNPYLGRATISNRRPKSE